MIDYRCKLLAHVKAPKRGDAADVSRYRGEVEAAQRVGDFLNSQPGGTTLLHSEISRQTGVPSALVRILICRINGPSHGITV